MPIIFMSFVAIDKLKSRMNCIGVIALVIIIVMILPIVSFIVVTASMLPKINSNICTYLRTFYWAIFKSIRPHVL